MPFQDRELDNLAQYRDYARQRRERAKGVLDDARFRRDSLRRSLGHNVDALTSERDGLSAEIESCFSNSNSAYSVRDYDNMRYWKSRAHDLIERVKDVKVERSGYIQQLKDAGEAFKSALDDYNVAKEEHERRRDAFNVRLEHLKAEAVRQRAVAQAEREQRQRERAEYQRHRDEERAQQARELERQLAEWARRFGDGRSDSIKVKYKPNLAYTDIYFGGVGRPDGDGHGHIRVLENGTEVIVREPFKGDRRAKREATLIDSATPDRRRRRR